jgi:pimeloyl-ACP methyl ester carboxylesterase
MGGAAVALAAVRGLRLDAAVLVGAPSTPAAFVDRFEEALELRPAVAAALRARLGRRVGIPVDALDIVRLAPAAGTPLLVLHDRDDAEVPLADGAAVAAAWPEARLIVTEGLGHRRILRDAAVAAEVTGFLLARLPRCGCGRLATGCTPAAGGGAEPRCAGCAVAEELWARPRRWAAAAGHA